MERLQEAKQKERRRRKRGRPEKPLKTDDHLRNLARKLCGLPPLEQGHRLLD